MESLVAFFFVDSSTQLGKGSLRLCSLQAKKPLDLFVQALPLVSVRPKRGIFSAMPEFHFRSLPASRAHIRVAFDSSPVGLLDLLPCIDLSTCKRSDVRPQIVTKVCHRCFIALVSRQKLQTLIHYSILFPGHSRIVLRFPYLRAVGQMRCCKRCPRSDV
jgi:hypothetical protein